MKTFNNVSGRPMNDWTPMKVDIAGASHQGHVRGNNEDSYLIIRFGRSLERLATNLDEELLEQNYSITGHGMLVADGMGGMAAGEVASRMALSSLIELILDTTDWTLALKRDRDVKTVLDRMTRRFFKIDKILRDEADRDDTLEGMGTTLTVAGALGTVIGGFLFGRYLRRVRNALEQSEGPRLSDRKLQLTKLNTI